MNGRPGWTESTERKVNDVRTAEGNRAARIAGTGILFALLLFICAGAHAAEWKLTASCPSRGNETVCSWTTAGVTTLCVPGFWDLSAVTLEVEGQEKIYLGPDRLEIKAGEPADLRGMTDRRLKVLDAQQGSGRYVTIMQGSEICALFLEVDQEGLKLVNRNRDNPLETGRIVFCEPDGQVSYDGELTQLKGRGNITFNFSKKPYQFKLKEKASLAGMEKGKTWILLANWTDRSLLRNQIVLDMSREVGLRYAVGCAQTDVWINGVYNGLYLLTEKIQVGKNRVNITNLEEETENVNSDPFDPGELEKKKREGYNLFRSYPAVLDPEDVTGGYIAVIEKSFRLSQNDFPGFRTDRQLSIYIKEPTYPSTAQVEYLGRTVTELQHALMTKDGICPESGKHYTDYLDMESFALKYLIEDWCKNYDYMAGSQYFYKDSDRIDPKIYAGPAWDYDLSFGNMEDRGILTTAGYLNNIKQDNNIYWLLYTHEEFRELVAERWRSVFRPAVGVLLGETPPREDGTLRSFEDYREGIRASAAMNYRKWGKNSATSKISGEFFSTATPYLENWIRKHTAAMDEMYGYPAETE